MSYSPQNDRIFNDAEDPEWDNVQIESDQKTPILVYFHAFFLVIASVLVRNSKCIMCNIVGVSLVRIAK